MALPRHQLVTYAHKMAKTGLVSGSEGNLSLRTKEGIYLSPTGRLLEDLEPKDLVLTDEKGKVLEGGKPTSEWRLHLALYEKRPDIKAILHAHPSYTLALNLVGHDFKRLYLAEAALFLSKVALVPFAPPGTEELAQKAADMAQESNVLILEKHGAVALGRDLAQAFNLLCLLEKVSQVVWLALNLNPEVKPLSEEEIGRIKEVYS